MQGRIDVVRPDGLIEGWCWDEDLPEKRVSITVLIDGIDAGSCLAALYREDLRLAKIGDGFCAFSFVTQILPSNDKRTQNYTLIESETRRPVGAPMVVHNKLALSIDNRLIELENRNRLLMARLDEVSRRENQTSSSEMFAIVGDFFTRLSQDISRGEPLSLERRLSDIATAAAAEHGFLSFPSADRADVSVLVQAWTSLAQTHACLKSLLLASTDVSTSVTVLDTGDAPDTVLIPTVARNILYVRTVADLTSEWCEAERGDAAPILIMVGSAAVVSDGFLTEVTDAFANNSKAAAIGAHALESGAPWGGGFCLTDGILKDCSHAGHPEKYANIAGSYPTHAVSYQAVAFRRTALREVGGLDSIFGNDLGAAVIDLCFRLRLRGWTVLTQSFATIQWRPEFGEESWFPRGLEGASQSADVLRARWFDTAVSHAPLFIGHAAILGLAGSFLDELSVVRQFREWGYSVEYLGALELSTDNAEALRRAGSLVNRSEDLASALRSTAASIVYASVYSSVLDQKAAGCRVAIGGSALRAMHSSDEATSNESLEHPPRLRQMAGS